MIRDLQKQVREPVHECLVLNEAFIARVGRIEHVSWDSQVRVEGLYSSSGSMAFLSVQQCSLENRNQIC